MLLLLHLLLVISFTKTSLVLVSAKQTVSENDVSGSEREMEEEKLLCEYFTDIETLRKKFGTGRDLDSTQTRELYHRLIPNCLLDSYEQWLKLRKRKVQLESELNQKEDNDDSAQQNEEDDNSPSSSSSSIVCSLAKTAFKVRKLAKKYARERATYANYLLSIGVDLVRGYGVNGQSDDIVAFWNSYVRRIMDDNEMKQKMHVDGDDSVSVEHCLINDEYDGLLFGQTCEPVCEAILRASVRTNQAVNQWAGVDNDSSSSKVNKQET